MLIRSVTRLCSRTTLPSSAQERWQRVARSPSSSARMLTECRDRSESCRSSELRVKPHTSTKSSRVARRGCASCCRLLPAGLHTSLGSIVRLQKGMTMGWRGWGGNHKLHRRSSYIPLVLLPPVGAQTHATAAPGGKLRRCWTRLERLARRASSFFFPSFLLFFFFGGEETLLLLLLLRTEAAPVSPAQHVRLNLHNKSLSLRNHGKQGCASITSARFYTQKHLCDDFHEVFGVF